jgi:hypothetical protein
MNSSITILIPPSEFQDFILRENDLLIAFPVYLMLMESKLTFNLNILIRIVVPCFWTTSSQGHLHTIVPLLSFAHSHR